MTQNLEESVKIVKNALEAGGVYPDAVSKNNDGHIIVRDGFFYKSGRTAEGHTHKIKKALDAAGIKHSIVDDGEHNAPFRGGASVARNSHFYTHIKLHEDTLTESAANRPDHFAFTHTPGDSESERKLAKLKSVVSDHNKTSDFKLRVLAKGRMGKDNPNAEKYKRDHTGRTARPNSHGYQTITLADAKHHDLYVAPRNESDASGRSHEDQRTHHAIARNVTGYFKHATGLNMQEEVINEVSKDLLKRYVAKGDRSYDQLNDKAYNAWKSSDDLRDNPAAYKKTTDAAVKFGRKADRRALSLNKADARLAEEMTTSQRHDKHYDEQPEHVKNNLNTHLRNGMTYPDAVAREVGKHQGATPLNEAYPSAAAMARKAKAVKQARAVATGYANQKSGKWSSQSYKTEDGRWASKDVKEETLVERYKRATSRVSLWEASSQTLVATKGSDKASRYEMHTRMPGEASEYSSIIKTHQDGKPLQNQWGGYNTLRTGKTAYVKKHFDKLDEELDLNEGTIGSWSNAGPFIRVTKGTDRVTKKPARHVEIHDMGNKTRLITSVHPDWKNEDIKNHLIKTHGKKLDNVHWNLDEEVITELSKGTLGSYIKKASNDVASKAVEYGTKKAERDEVDRITNRHMKYADKDTVHQALKTTSDDVEGPRVKAAKRIGGISKAVNKLTNEDVQLDEAPYYSLEASKARMAKEKARAAAKAAIAAAKADSSIARKEARENRSLHIARHIEAEVGNHYPDSDGFEAISNKVRKMGIPHHEVIDHLDKAARKHLGAKSFDHYVDNFHKDYQGSMNESKTDQSRVIADHIKNEISPNRKANKSFMSLSQKLRGMGIPAHEVGDRLSHAARKHLGARDFHAYADKVHKHTKGISN